MKKYQAFGKAGVEAYEILDDGIIVKFRNSLIYYLYNYQKPGKRHVEEMKMLAEQGLGLSTYISQQVKENYYAKLTAKSLKLFTLLF